MENKRRRGDEVSSLESPAAKRLRQAAILEILDSDVEVAGLWGDDLVAASDDLATVVQSLEQEIALAGPAPGEAASPPPELGYLLEASDDELGIPPPEAEEGRRNEELEAAAAFWFAEDEISSGYCYDELGLGFVRYGEEDEGSAFDCAPFDYAQDLVWTV